MKKYYAILTIILYLFAVPSHAKKNEAVLLDSESIAWLKDMADPLLRAADIDPKTVNIYVVRSEEINAFVTGNRDVFFYSGLILKATTPEEVQGVLAHEIGHIKGKHYIKTLAKSDDAGSPILIGSLLSAGAAILGSPVAAMALISGALASTQDQALKHSRSQERQADSIAIKLLNQSNTSAKGLVSFFDKLRVSNLLYSKTPPAWLITHPLPKQRISAVENHIKNETLTEVAKPLDKERFKRIQAKLIAFTKSKDYTSRKYGYKKTPDAVYANAIVLALKGKINDAIEMIEGMSPSKASLPFHYEILAQLHQDNADYTKAHNAFKKALEINPDLEFIRLQMAQNLITLKRFDEAIRSLHIVAHLHPTWGSIFKSLGVAYGRKGQLFDSHIFLAKEAHLRKSQHDVKMHLQWAEKYMEKGNKKQKKNLEEAKKILEPSEKG